MSCKHPAAPPSPFTCSHCDGERIEELECELSKQVSARDLTIRDLRANLVAERKKWSDLREGIKTWRSKRGDECDQHTLELILIDMSSLDHSGD